MPLYIFHVHVHVDIIRVLCVVWLLLHFSVRSCSSCIVCDRTHTAHIIVHRAMCLCNLCVCSLSLSRRSLLYACGVRRGRGALSVRIHYVHCRAAAMCVAESSTACVPCARARVCPCGGADPAKKEKPTERASPEAHEAFHTSLISLTTLSLTHLHEPPATRDPHTL